MKAMNTFYILSLRDVSYLYAFFYRYYVPDGTKYKEISAAAMEYRRKMDKT